MQQTSKLLLVGLLCLVLGASGLYAWQQFSLTVSENAELKSQLVTAPSVAPITIAPTNKPLADELMPSNPEVTQTPETNGALSGTLGYPSEGIPPLEVYAFKQGDASAYFKVATAQNQQTFSLTDVAAGTYIVVAYPKDGAGLVGGYTYAVACGLSVECTDHSLVPVVVKAGETTEGVMVKDWYAPAGTFPAKPK